MKLSENQKKLLYRLAMPSGDPVVRYTCHISGRGDLNSIKVLGRLGLAKYIGPGSFGSEHWRITDAGVKERWNQ